LIKEVNPVSLRKEGDNCAFVDLSVVTISFSPVFLLWQCLRLAVNKIIQSDGVCIYIGVDRPKPTHHRSGVCAGDKKCQVDDMTADKRIVKSGMICVRDFKGLCPYF
jgi:hypothetical protein